MNKTAKTILCTFFSLSICLLSACGTDTTDSAQSVPTETESSASDVASNPSSNASSDTNSELTEEQKAMQQYIPSSWEKQIETVNRKASGNFVFGVQTDIHHVDTTNADLCKNLIATSYFVEFDCVAILGDLIRGYTQDVDNPQNMRDCMDDLVNRYTQSNCPALMTFGNHDANHMWNEKHTPGDFSTLINEKERYSRVIAPLMQHNGENMVVKGENTYYYMDFPEKNVRVVMLNTSDDKFSEGFGKTYRISDEQLTWFTREALDTDKYVIVMSHIPLHSLSSKNPTGAVYNAIEVMQAVKGFENEGGKFVGYFHGHMHERSLEIDDNGHFHMGFLNGANPGETVIVDLENRVVETVIMGNGESRRTAF